MISYEKLFEKLKKQGITQTQLSKQAKISTRTIAKLKKGENITSDIIEKVCLYLNCQPGDIMNIKKPDGKILSILKEERQMNLKGGLYHQTQILMAYNSNHIEGSRLTEEQTRYIYETNTIGVTKDLGSANIDDIIETVNHFSAFRYLLDIANETLSESIIKEFHKILKTGTSDAAKEWFNVGEYKSRPNVVGNKETSSPKNVSKDISVLLKNYISKDAITISDIIEFHHKFECIHPFQDGNGRVGRLVMFKECLKNDLIPIIILDSFKDFYYRGLKEFEKEKGYLNDTCLHGQDIYEELTKKFII